MPRRGLGRHWELVIGLLSCLEQGQECFWWDDALAGQEPRGRCVPRPLVMPGPGQ